MKRYLTAIPIAFVVGSIFLGGILYMRVMTQSCLDVEERNLQVLTTCLSRYIQDNDGAFPASIEDLINGGYLLRVAAGPSGQAVSYRIAVFDPNRVTVIGEIVRPYKEWRFFPYFTDFQILYGAQLQNMTVSGDTIVDASTGSPVFLVNGMWSRKAPQLYMEPSLRLYREMVHAQKE